MKPQSARRLQTAAAHFSNGQLSQAEVICREILQNEPQVVDVIHLLALIQRQLGDVQQALALFQQCLEQQPGRADIRANMGNLFAAAGQMDAAIECYQQAIDDKPSFRPARLGLTRILNAAGRHEEAAQHADKLLKRDHKDAEALVALGMARRGMDDSDGAEDAYRRALQVKPNYGAAHHNLGALLSQRSRSEEALEELQHALGAGVRGPEIAYNLSTALAGLNRFDEAESILAETVHNAPLAIDAQRQLARLRFMRGTEDFAAGLKTALARQPDQKILRIALSQILRAAGQFEQARDVMVSPNQSSADPASLIELACLYQDLGQYEDASNAAKMAVDIEPQNVSAADALLDGLLSMGRADEVMPLIMAMRQRFPLNQWYISMEATAARLLGDPRYESLYDYERFVRKFVPEAPPGWSNLDEFHRDLNAALIERHKLQVHPLDQSLRNGTQTPRGLLGDPDPVIQAFIESLKKPIAEYRAHIGTDGSHEMTKRNVGEPKMTGCWSVRLKKGGFHVNHVHPEGWISSAYYAEVPAEVSDEQKKCGWIKFGEPRYPVPGATPEKFVQPEAGSLVLFPSYMWHGTTAIHGDSPRMTVAFDAIAEKS